MKFTKIPSNTFNHLQMNAGFLTTDFTPGTGTASAPMAATTGGLTFTATPEFTDFGEDIDNCPKNTKELKRITGYEVTISGNMLTIDHVTCKMLLAAASVTGPVSDGAPYKFEPSMTLQDGDFNTLWFVGDYSSDNTDANGGFVAIKLINALNTGGFQLTTTDKGKGQFAFTFTGHTSINSPETVPFELYLKETLPTLSVVSTAGTTTGKTKLTVSGYTLGTGESYKYKTAATVSLPNPDASVSAWTTWNGTDEISATSGHEIAVCVADSNNLAVAGGKTTVVVA